MLIKNAKIHTVTKGTIEKGSVRVSRGQIKEIAKAIKAQKGEEIIDAKGMNLFPGFIDAHCHLGLYAEPITWANDDGNECSDPVTPHIRAIDAITPEDFAFSDALSAGVTSVFTGPGSGNVIGGQSTFIKTGGSLIIDQRVVRDFCGLKTALGENPKRVYQEKKRTPTSRMGTAAVMREAFLSAKEYQKKMKSKNKPDFDMKKDILKQVLDRKVPVRCHAHRLDDIATIIRIRDEFNFDLVVEHATDAHKIADYIAQKKVPCVIGPSMSTRSKEELKDISFKTVKTLYDAGVLFAIMTDAPVIPIKYLPHMVGYALKEGIPWEEGLKAITINAAEICGVSSRVGSIEIGKDADLTLYDGDPFTIAGECKMTMVNGEVLFT